MRQPMCAFFLPDMAQFISQTEMNDIPAQAVTRAKLVITDCVGAIVGGMAEPEMLRLAAMQQPAVTHNPRHRPEYGLLTAAFLNGMVDRA